MAKPRSFKSKKELEKEGRTLGIELDRRHSKEDLIEELEAVKPKKVESTTSDVTWNSIEEFTEAVTSTGMIFAQDFIPVNIEALYEAFTSNPEEFKETPAYKFLTQ